MALKCIFKFESLDSTRSLNQRSELLFKKGIYFGGKITTDETQITNVITVSPFRLISYDGMHVLSDSNISIPLEIGEFLIVCRAKYVIDDSPDISVLAIEKNVYEDLPDEEKLNYVIFALVSSNSSGIAEINTKEYREEISQIGRNPCRGYFESEEELFSIEPFEGDFATVKSSNPNEVILYVYNGVRWVGYINPRDISTELVNHQNNNDVDIAHFKPSVEESLKEKGAYHVNWNQLNSLSDLENANILNDSFDIDTVGHIQTFDLKYGKLKSITVTPYNEYASLTKKDNSNLTLNTYYVDDENGILYIYGQYGAKYSCNYSYSHIDKKVVVQYNFTRSVRNTEAEALEGNKYFTDNYKKHVPSKDNRYITSLSPSPKRIKGSFIAKLISNNYYLVCDYDDIYIFIGGLNENKTSYFEVIGTYHVGNEDLPIAINDVKVFDTSSNTIRNFTSSDIQGECWFKNTSTKRVALKVVGYSSLTANELTQDYRYNVNYHVLDGLGNFSDLDSIDYLANKIYKNTFREFNTVKVNKLFSIDNYFESCLSAKELYITDGSYYVRTGIYGLYIKHNSTDYGYLNIDTTNAHNIQLYSLNALKINSDEEVSDNGIYIGDGTRKIKLNGIENTLILMNRDSNKSSINIEAKKSGNAVINISARKDSNDTEFSHIKLEEGTSDEVTIEAKSSTKNTKVEISNGKYSSIKVTRDNVSNITKRDSISLSTKEGGQGFYYESEITQDRESTTIRSGAGNNGYSSTKETLVSINSSTKKISLESGDVDLTQNRTTFSVGETSILAKVSYVNGASTSNSSTLEISNNSTELSTGNVLIDAYGTTSNKLAVEIRNTESTHNKGIEIGSYLNNSYTNSIQISDEKINIQRNSNSSWIRISNIIVDDSSVLDREENIQSQVLYDSSDIHHSISTYHSAYNYSISSSDNSSLNQRLDYVYDFIINVDNRNLVNDFNDKGIWFVSKPNKSSVLGNTTVLGLENNSVIARQQDATNKRQLILSKDSAIIQAGTDSYFSKIAVVGYYDTIENSEKRSITLQVKNNNSVDDSSFTVSRNNISNVLYRADSQLGISYNNLINIHSETISAQSVNDITIRNIKTFLNDDNTSTDETNEIKLNNHGMSGAYASIYLKCDYSNKDSHGDVTDGLYSYFEMQRNNIMLSTVVKNATEDVYSNLTLSSSSCSLSSRINNNCNGGFNSTTPSGSSDPMSRLYVVNNGSKTVNCYVESRLHNIGTSSTFSSVALVAESAVDGNNIQLTVSSSNDSDSPVSIVGPVGSAGYYVSKTSKATIIINGDIYYIALIKHH